MPELIGIVKGFDLGHVNEDGQGSVVCVLWTLEEEGVALVVDRAMARDGETLFSVCKGETRSATARGGEPERRVVAVESDSLADEAEGVEHGGGEVHVG